ncbi:hypothetical protein [Actinoplanes sp. NPDC051411]|uniref:hypothetical protein n=1 Tax=Actinoplanes sp. NPDC051411 TaxID=3155522 RepID=UPI00342D0E3B
MTGPAQAPLQPTRLTRSSSTPGALAQHVSALRTHAATMRAHGATFAGRVSGLGF